MCRLKNDREEVLQSILVIVLFLCGISWALYGLCCALSCDMIQEICISTEINVQIKVCQNQSDFSYRPYSGYVKWCFPTGNTVSCISELAACSYTSEIAFFTANSTFPVGTKKTCWLSPAGGNYFYFQWSIIDLPLWFKINVYYSIFTGVVTVILVVILVVNHIRKRQYSTV